MRNIKADYFYIRWVRKWGAMRYSFAETVTNARDRLATGGAQHAFICRIDKRAPGIDQTGRRGRSTWGRGIRTRVARRGVRCPTCPDEKARAIAGFVHLAGFCARTPCANARTAGSIRAGGIAQKPIRKRRRALLSSFMKNTPPGWCSRFGDRAAAVPAGEGIHRKARRTPRSCGRQDAVMPMPNTCILPALTWRGSTMLVTTLPGGTGIFCAKM
ncbi:hypothetical protein BLA23254_05347 [Burkholderia lata]|uniref:Uncharacterized protein n=1 Tax=Burkholderia lata (strain ATCC 17760 / DSM 23089 / LMG 22485 / NCIMB 9086 / R18194 / 383) TaxID=482957 RepID=A0A6P2PXL4_BURL3|nr:hypothetical protein BLA23254_05347 [Burkholderia lata]